MISKKFVAALCIAVVIGAIGGGFIGYVIAGRIMNLENRVDSLQETVSSLEGQIDELENETDRLQNELTHKKNIRTFNFYWEASIAEYFNVTRFWMNVTFERVNETNLVITVKANDLRDEWWIEQHVVISSELTRQYEGKSWMYLWERYPFNKTYWAKYLGGIGAIVPMFYPSDHQVYYEPQLGVTYIIPVKLVGLEIDNDRIYVGYASKVSVEFCFGMELVA